MESVTITPSAIRSEVIDCVRMVGATVTFRDSQYKIHSVEGPDYYAFGDKTGQTDHITIDFDMAGGWRNGVYVYLVPAGCVVGDGHGLEVPIEWIKPGVCLTKQGDSVWH